MEIGFDRELEAKLNRVAAENRRSADEYVRQLVKDYVDHDAWFRRRVRKGLDQLDRGESVSHEEVGADRADVPLIVRIRWSGEAVDDLTGIVAHIRNDNARAAERVAPSIYARASALASFPMGGRRDRIEGTRELPLTPLPFILVYRLIEVADGTAVQNVNVMHGARRWP